MTLSWGGNTDPHKNKSSYMMGHGLNIPDIMLALKHRNDEKREQKEARREHATAPFGAVNYLGYEATAQPTEFSVPRHLTNGLKPQTFGECPAEAAPLRRPPPVVLGPRGCMTGYWR